MKFKFNEIISISNMTLDDIEVYSSDALEENNIISFLKTENLEILKIIFKNLSMKSIFY